jgi:purine-binding chemotaxis protein CheW
MSNLHVLFTVGDAVYVIASTEVREMETFGGATRIPGTAPYVAGLVQIRGRVIPVIDLRARFGLPPIERTLDARVIVVAEGDREVGLLADTAREVVKIEADQFGPPPDVVSQQAAGFVNAIAETGKRLVLRVDASRVIGKDTVLEESN